jgi:hypothetical protein
MNEPLEAPENRHPPADLGNCSDCDGTGKESCINDSCECGDTDHRIECHKCEGSGEIELEECYFCDQTRCQCDSEDDRRRGN